MRLLTNDVVERGSCLSAIDIAAAAFDRTYYESTDEAAFAAVVVETSWKFLANVGIGSVAMREAPSWGLLFPVPHCSAIKCPNLTVGESRSQEAL